MKAQGNWLLQENGSANSCVLQKDGMIFLTWQRVAAKYHDSKWDQIYNHHLNPEKWNVKYFD